MGALKSLLFRHIFTQIASIFFVYKTGNTSKNKKILFFYIGLILYLVYLTYLQTGFPGFPARPLDILRLVLRI